MNKDDYELIISHVNNLTCIFLSYGTYKEDDISQIVDLGIKIAETSYENKIKLDTYGSPVRDEFEKQRPDIINGDVRFFWGMCRYAGQEIRDDTPENINLLLNSAHRAKNKIKTDLVEANN